jgi:hypothetical protein
MGHELFAGCALIYNPTRSTEAVVHLHHSDLIALIHPQLRAKKDTKWKRCCNGVLI